MMEHLAPRVAGRRGRRATFGRCLKAQCWRLGHQLRTYARIGIAFLDRHRTGANLAAWMVSGAFAIWWIDHYTDWFKEFKVVRIIIVFAFAVHAFVLGKRDGPLSEPVRTAKGWLVVIPLTLLLWLISLAWGTVEVSPASDSAGASLRLRPFLGRRERHELIVDAKSFKIRLPLWHGARYHVWLDNDPPNVHALNPFQIHKVSLHRAVMIMPTGLLAATVRNEHGWEIRVFQNLAAVPLCTITPYVGQVVRCGGAWQPNDCVTVKCKSPKVGEYECGTGSFNPAPGRRAEVQINVE